jgi:hypothetical protein
MKRDEGGSVMTIENNIIVLLKQSTIMKTSELYSSGISCNIDPISHLK